MKILLPSQGLHGSYKVRVRVPTFKDIYAVQDEATDEMSQMFMFLEDISDIDFSKVTFDDVTYVFTIVAYSLLNNKLTYNLKCEKCGNSVEKAILLQDLDVVQLKAKKRNLPFSKRINTVKYTYTIPTAADILEAYEQAQYEDNEERAFQDLRVAAIMGHKGDISYVRSIPVSVYASALVFEELNFHGIRRGVKIECPNCGHSWMVSAKVGPSILEFDRSAIMQKYVSVNTQLSFVDFMAMSIRGFNDFVSLINKKQK